MELDQKLVDLIEGIITVKQQEAYKQGRLHGKAGAAKSDKYVYYTKNSGIDKEQSDYYIKGYEHGMREKENPHKKDAEDHEAWREKTAAARKGRYYHESVEDTLDEVLTAKTPISTWIEDFIKSDDPKFNGKSKEERRKMAIGAFYGAKNAVKEDLQESISKGGSTPTKQRDYIIHFERDEPFGAANPKKVNDSMELKGQSKEHVRYKFENMVKEGDVSGVKVRHIMRKF